MKNIVIYFHVLVASLTFFVLNSCGTYDLGNAGNYYYRIDNPSAPTWGGGIGNVVINKCATCHTSSNPWYKPKNVPDFINADNPNFSLTNIGAEQFFNSSNSTLKNVKTCLEATCGKDNIPMPPNYATPLNDEEKKALLAFVTALVPASTSGLGQFFISKCAGCHGDDGKKKSGSTLNKAIGESQSDTFAKFQTTYKTLSPMPGYSTGYTDADAQADWKLITGK